MQVNHPFEIGKSYLIRTVTNYFTGRVVKMYDNWLVLEDAAWVADTGRYHVAVSTGKLNEVEPIPGPTIVGLGSVVDAVGWPEGVELPRKAI